ncbi:MAG: peptidoglycan binding domain-containing protein [Clostridia bacterium]|nr:peptidoglycan binding domain-containing protein [Clostridia bacterium]
MKEKEEIQIIEENIQTKEKEEVQDKKKQEIKQEDILQKESDVAILEKEELETNEKIEDKQEEKKKTDGLQRYTKMIVVISILLFIAAMIFSTVFALINKSSDKIVEGVSIKGISVSGLTREEAANKINEVFDKQLTKNITLKHENNETTIYQTVITPEQIEMKYKLTEAIDLAYSIGRTGKVLKDNYDIINARLAKIEINPAYSYNDELLTNCIISDEENLPDIVKQSGYSVDGSNLIINKGQKGVAIEQESLKKQIIEACANLRRRRNHD